MFKVNKDGSRYYVLHRFNSPYDGARLSFSGGAADQTFRIETKTDLNAPLWQTIATNQFGIDGKFQFLDTDASNYPTRFYRSATRCPERFNKTPHSFRVEGGRAWRVKSRVSRPARRP